MRKFLTLIAMVLAMNGAMAKERSALRITLASGEVVTVRTESGLSFQKSYDTDLKEYVLQVTAEGEAVDYLFSNVTVMKFVDGATDVALPSEDAAAASGVSFTISGKTVTISGAAASEVVVYGIDGTRQPAGISGNGGTVRVDLSACGAGNYIIRLKTNSIKVRIQ